MSRVGKSPINIPVNVSVTISGDLVTVDGPKGSLTQPLMQSGTVKQEDSRIVVSRSNDQPKVRALHGLMRALLNNMVIGVSEGFSKKLEINGVGYRVAMVGSDLKFNIGLSHDVTYKIPQGVVATVEQNTITITGISRQQVGQVAAEIRSLKKPEPYKGKGIKYQDERILRKSGKSGKDK